MDNRSASLNSEHVSAIYDKDFAKKVADMISKDMAPDVAKPLSADEIRNRIKAAGLQGSLTSLFAGLM